MVAIDIIVLGVILVAGIIGLVSGVVKMAYKVVSFILSIVIAVKFTEPVAKVFQNAGFYKKMVDSIYQNMQGKVISVGVSIMDNINQLIDQLPLPENIKPVLVEKSAEKAASTATSGTNPTAYAVSTGIADFITVVIAGILLFIVIRILFMFIGFAVNKLADAPIIKQVDRSVGLLLGFVIGLMIIFSLFTGITMLASSDKLGSLITMINDSTIAYYLYNNNPISNLLAEKM